MDEPNALEKAARMSGRVWPDDYGSPDDDAIAELPGDDDEDGLRSPDLEIEDSGPP